METNFDYANDVVKQNARMFKEAFKSRKQILTRETIKQTVEDFFGEHE